MCVHEFPDLDLGEVFNFCYYTMLVCFFFFLMKLWGNKNCCRCPGWRILWGARLIESLCLFLLIFAVSSRGQFNLKRGKREKELFSSICSCSCCCWCVISEEAKPPKKNTHTLGWLCGRKMSLSLSHPCLPPSLSFFFAGGNSWDEEGTSWEAIPKTKLLLVLYISFCPHCAIHTHTQ